MQVQPPLTKMEMTVLFVNTLHAPYYEKLVEKAIKSFTDMVISGKMIENVVKSRKLDSKEKKGGTT